jgi:myo-inositol-1-phosphate synthase
LSEAILASENNTIKIADVPPLNVTVQRGHTFDGLGKYYRETIVESDAEPVDVVAALREARADVRGPTSSQRQASRSSATTSRARSARPSPTACSRSCSRTAASPSTGPTSSTSAATWTS